MNDGFGLSDPDNLGVEQLSAKSPLTIFCFKIALEERKKEKKRKKETLNYLGVPYLRNESADQTNFFLWIVSGQSSLVVPSFNLIEQMVPEIWDRRPLIIAHTTF